MPWISKLQTVFRIAKLRRKVDQSLQYVCLPIIPNPKPLIKHDMVKVTSHTKLVQKTDIDDYNALNINVPKPMKLFD